MDSQEVALLETIHARPDDDGPRLVYADWLEERGRCELAEFIRVQIERADRDDFDPVQKLLAHRERELIETHGHEWVAPPLRELVAYEPPVDEPPVERLDPNRTRRMHPESRWQFRRGFPWVEVSVAQFVANAAMIVDSAPFIQIHIGTDGTHEIIQRTREPSRWRPRREAFRDLFASPILPTGIGLTLVEKSDWKALRQLRPAVQITALHVSGPTTYGRDLRELKRPAFARLRELTLEPLSLSNNAVNELAAASSVASLRTLRLTGNRLTADAIASLTSGVSAERLRVLDLSDNPISDDGAALLARWPGLASVRVLRLAGCGLSDQGAQALADSPHLDELRQLNLQRNRICSSGVSALLGAPWVRRLALLDLSGTELGARGAAELIAAAELLPSLRRLCLSLDRDGLTDDDVEDLTAAYGNRLILDWFEPPAAS